MTLHPLIAILALSIGIAPPVDGYAEAPPLATQPTSAVAVPATDAELDAFVSLITGNNEPDARQFGAGRLLRTGSDSAVDRLTSILKNSANPAAQIAVCRAIAAQSGPAPRLVEPLLLLLGDTRADLNDAVSAALRRFDSSLVVKRLRPLASQSDVPLPRRLAAITALGGMSDEIQAVAALIAIIRDEHGDMQAAALEALSRACGIRHESPKAACDWWEARRDLSPIQWLQEVNARRTDQAILLQQQNARLTARLISACREAYLATPDADRTRKLLDLLKDDLKDLRLLALGLINAMITDRQQVGQDIKSRLLEMTIDPDPDARIAVARLIGDLRLPNGVARLVSALAAEREPRVRSAQISAIGRFDDIAAIPLLIDRLGDEAPAVVAEAALALGSMARRGNGRAAVEEQVLPVLTDRFSTIPLTDAALREQFILALAQIPSDSLRSLFEAELTPDRPISVRRAALTALGAFADSAAASVIRPLVSAAGPELRLAAVAALGRAGNNQSDLEALESRLDPSTEADAAVRDRAWQSYLAIAQRLSPADQIARADGFASDEAKSSQRRRLEILKALHLDAARFDDLAENQQVHVLDAIGDAQQHLGEFKDAIESYGQALDLITEAGDAAERNSIITRLTDCLLKTHDDAEAVQRITEALHAAAPNSNSEFLAALARILLAESQIRLDAANDAEDFAELFNLLDSTQPLLDRLAGLPLQQAALLRQDAQRRRSQQIDNLIGSLLTDPAAESKLITHGPAHVLPRICTALDSLELTADSALEIDQRLVDLARKLAPSWSGYPPSAQSDDRHAAIARLHEIADQLKTVSRSDDS